MSSFQKLFTFVKVIYLLIRCYKSRLFLWNTSNTDRNGVSKQNTYTPNTQRKITLEKFSMKISDIPSFKTTSQFSKILKTQTPLYKVGEGAGDPTVLPVSVSRYKNLEFSMFIRVISKYFVWNSFEFFWKMKKRFRAVFRTLPNILDESLCENS